MERPSASRDFEYLETSPLNRSEIFSTVPVSEPMARLAMNRTGYSLLEMLETKAPVPTVLGLDGLPGQASEQAAGDDARGIDDSS